MDPHLNVFYAYRGSADSDEVRERQLEDNLTRALVVTLDRLQGAPASRPLLQVLGISKGACSEPYACELQVQKARHVGGRRCHLVVLHAGPELKVLASVGKNEEATGRPDATIRAATYAVAIEAKLGSTVSQSQLDAHWRTLRFPGTLSSMDVTWYAIAQAAGRSARQSPRDSLAQFLLLQLEEYLRMTGFGGLIEDHFAYFALDSDERDRDSDTKEAIRRALHHLLDGIRVCWSTSWEVKVGKVLRSEDHAWGILHPSAGPPESRTRKQRPHLTLAIRADGLGLFANVENVGPHGRFVKAFKHDPDGFLDFLAGLEQAGTSPPLGWRFETARRVRGERPRDYKTAPGVAVSAATAGEMPRPVLHEVISAAIRKPTEEAVPEIMIRRDYPAAAVIRDEDLVAHLADDARALEPFFEWIGEPVNK